MEESRVSVMSVRLLLLLFEGGSGDTREEGRVNRDLRVWLKQSDDEHEAREPMLDGKME